MECTSHNIIAALNRNESFNNLTDLESFWDIVLDISAEFDWPMAQVEFVGCTELMKERK